MHPMEVLHITTQDELQLVAQKALELLKAHAQEGCASVLALEGDLGSGKTTFVQTFAASLGIDETVTSPTYVIQKLYYIDSPGMPYTKMYHLDAYRIEDTDEMRVLGFEETLHMLNTVVCIEWAERISALLPAHTVYIRFEITQEGGRTVTFS